jgi:hypothetical protein
MNASICCLNVADNLSRLRGWLTTHSGQMDQAPDPESEELIWKLHRELNGLREGATRPRRGVGSGVQALLEARASMDKARRAAGSKRRNTSSNSEGSQQRGSDDDHAHTSSRRRHIKQEPQSGEGLPSLHMLQLG